MKTCPTCGQPMRERRLGVLLSPQQATVFDHIRRAGIGGCSVDTLRQTMGHKKARSIQTQIYLINAKLAEVGYRLISIERQWHLVRLEPYPDLTKVAV